jgi:hypothetical protein
VIAAFHAGYRLQVAMKLYDILIAGHVMEPVNILKKSGDTILVFLLLDWIFGQNSKRLDNCQSRNIKRLLYFLAGVANPSIADSTKIYHLKFERVKN